MVLFKRKEACMSSGDCFEVREELSGLVLATRPRAEVIAMWIKDAEDRGMSEEDIRHLRDVCASWSRFLDTVFRGQPEAVTNGLLSELVDLDQPAEYFTQGMLDFIKYTPSDPEAQARYLAGLSAKG